MRSDFRAFRTDRIIDAKETGRIFRAERGKTLADFYRMMEIREDRLPESGSAEG